MKAIFTLITLTTVIAMQAQEYVRQPVSYLDDWIINDFTREEVMTDLPAAFHETMEGPSKLVLEKDIEDEGDGVEEIQVEFGPNGHIEMIRFSNEPRHAEIIAQDLRDSGYNMEDENEGDGYTEYEYVHPDNMVRVSLIVSQIDEQVTCHLVAIDEVKQ